MKKYKVKLRAKSEEKGCGYCTANSQGNTTTHWSCDVFGRELFVKVSKNELTVALSENPRNHSWSIPIKYCPFCGRKLEGEADEQ